MIASAVKAHASTLTQVKFRVEWFYCGVKPLQPAAAANSSKLSFTKQKKLMRLDLHSFSISRKKDWHALKVYEKALSKKFAKRRSMP